MLTEEQKQQNKLKYLNLLTTLGIDITELSKYLNSVNYFEKPNAIQGEYAYNGGLCEHALKLCHELGVLCEAYYPGVYTEATIIKTALMHGLYKATLYEEYNKNIKNETTGQWESIIAYRNKEDRPTFGDIGFSSYMIAKYFISFTDEEILAICHSSGINTFAPDMPDILKSYPLVTLIKMADMVVNYLV